MLRPLRPFVVLAVLALPAPALAENTAAPGALKKEQAPTPTASVPVQVPTTDTSITPSGQEAPTKPATTTAPQGKANGQQNTPNAKVPVTKGTQKKLASTTPSSGPASTGTTAHKKKAVRKHATVTQLGTSSTKPRAHHAARVHHQAAASRSHSASSATAATGTQSVAAGAPSVPSSHRRHHRTAHTPVKAANSTASLDPITRAADRVVEVIPGPIILAMAGLVTLVFLLIVRSLGSARRRTRELRRSYAITVEALATAVEAKDHTTGGHIERVRRLGLLLAQEIVPRETKDPQMAYGFLLHDIGKLSVPDAILRAPGRLTEEQWALMRRHPEEGVRMLSHVPFLDRALDVVLYHHERWDGGGYPEGLKGKEIPLWARIFSVVDTLDAMTADRPYRAGRSYAEALDEIKCLAGTQFDPKVVAALVKIPASDIEPLLEPTQQLPPGYEPLEELPVPTAPLVTA